MLEEGERGEPRFRWTALAGEFAPYISGRATSSRQKSGSHRTPRWSKTDSNPRSLSRKCRPLRPKGKCRSAQKGRPREGLPGTIPWLRGNISNHASDRAVLLSTTTLKVEIGAQPTASISPVTEGG